MNKHYFSNFLDRLFLIVASSLVLCLGLLVIIGWYIQIFPTAETLVSNQTILPNIVFASGLIFTALLAVTIFLTQVTLKAKQRLSYELSEKEKALAYQHAVLDSSIYSIITTTTDGKILVFNQAAERMLGYKADEVVNKYTPEIFHDESEIRRMAQELSIPVGFNVFIESTKSKKHNQREWTYIRKNGSRLPVMLSVSAVKDGKNGVIGYLGIAYDISQMKEAERMKNELIAVTSHELRSPLTAIRGSLGLLKVQPDQRSLLDIAIRNCDRLIHLTSDILDIQKMEAGKVEFIFKDFKLPTLISHSMEVNQVLAINSGCQIVIPAPAPNVIIFGDENRLLQVLNNLLSNAIKYSPQGGKISYVFTQHGDRVRIGIKDQGPGIPEESLHLLFQKFSQIPGVGKTGTGLGLNIAKAIVDRHGGTIEVESSSNGTTFWLELFCKTPITS